MAFCKTEKKAVGQNIANVANKEDLVRKTIRIYYKQEK